MCAPGRELGISDQLCHVRLVLAQARVCWYQHQWNETEQCLFEAQSLIARYDTFEKDGFYPLFVQLFLAAVHLCRDGHSEVECGYQHLDVAKRVKYFIPGLGTYFLSELQQVLLAKTGSL